MQAPARAVLPVFFGQADACRTISSEYEMLKTLNPQLARDSVLHKSRPKLMSVLCINKQMDVDLAQLVRDEMPRLDSYTERSNCSCCLASMVMLRFATNIWWGCVVLSSRRKNGARIGRCPEAKYFFCLVD